jgi:hypothetical protein
VGREFSIVSHPIETARHLVAQYAALCSDREIALAALDRLLEYATGDERCCAECQGTFYLTEPQREYFRARGLKEPVRCVACRAARRQHLASRGPG